MAQIRLALIGLGKIARDQHLPAIADSTVFSLAATISPQETGLAGVPHFPSLAELFADGPAIDAAILCTPPQVRYGLARDCLVRGLHVLLEKPPGATLGEVDALRTHAADSGATLLAGWHARYAPCVAPARTWLAGRRIDRVGVVWREDVRTWHPNQQWIWEPGGLGVFDPGINAFSILTHILPRPFRLLRATLQWPSNRAAPIAATLHLGDDAGAAMEIDLDWRQTGEQTWRIDIQTDDGPLTLTKGGAAASRRFVAVEQEVGEYPLMYRHFASLIEAGASEVDSRPLRWVADAFLCGRRDIVDAYID